MIKIKVKPEDVQAAKRFLTKQPGAPIALHDPVAQALKRVLAVDPRWRRPRVFLTQVELSPLFRYPKLDSVSLPLPKKVTAYVDRFEKWFGADFVGKDPGTIEFVLKGISVVDKRIVIG